MLRNNITHHPLYMHCLYICVPVYQYIKYINNNIDLAMVHRLVHSGTQAPETVHSVPGEALS
jgi:hypothetical protein